MDLEKPFRPLPPLLGVLSRKQLTLSSSLDFKWARIVLPGPNALNSYYSAKTYDTFYDPPPLNTSTSSTFNMLYMGELRLFLLPSFSFFPSRLFVFHVSLSIEMECVYQLVYGDSFLCRPVLCTMYRAPAGYPGEWATPSGVNPQTIQMPFKVTDWLARLEWLFLFPCPASYDLGRPSKSDAPTCTLVTATNWQCFQQVSI